LWVCYAPFELAIDNNALYSRDKDTVSLKCCGGEDESGVECESWCLRVLVGGGGKRYCGERAGETVIFFGTSVWCAAGLGGTLFGGKSSWEERVMAGKNIFVL